ncbi:MAG: ATP-binding protein [Rhodopseudomonas palustris]|nr:ATP-binding protein [Rhodopseudomonas palustris]
MLAARLPSILPPLTPAEAARSRRMIALGRRRARATASARRRGGRSARRITPPRCRR